MRNTQQNAFTLIELSIVLVIIGLIIGGIMAGKSLMEQAEIRSAVSQFQQIETGYRTFQTKYNCIMGDCTNATDFFGDNYVVVGLGCPPSGGAGNGNGNGDGFIDNGVYGGNWTCEPTQALRSLFLAGWLPSKIISPCRAGNSTLFKAMNDSCGYFYREDLYSQITPFTRINNITIATYTSGGSLANGALSPMQARVIDEKIDDGVPNKGKFRGLNAATYTSPGIVANSCFTSSVYNTNEDFTCRAAYLLK